MLGIAITIYILFTLAIGYWASRRIKTTDDFTLAGRSLSTLFVGVTIFATWFGPELVMGMPALFSQEGIQGIITDQFGTLLCLVLIARFYAKKMYSLHVVTINDFFRIRYNQSIETFTSFVNIVVYVLWISAQQLALALIFQSLFGIPVFWGLMLGATIVVIYTYMGGMWAVSFTDLIQSALIIIGLLAVLITLWGKTEGLNEILKSKEEGFLNFFPSPDFSSWTDYLAMWMAFGVGAIASQEIFQRALSGKSAKAAANGVYLSAFLLFVIGIIPILTGFIGGHLHPEFLIDNDGQNLIPDIVNSYASQPVKILFFGALISAILSTSSGALLAPATIIGENLFKSRIADLSDKRLLYITRLSVIGTALLAMIVANFSTNIHELVVLSAVPLMVCLFAPFTFGLFWDKSSVTGAWLSIIAGALTYFPLYFIDFQIEPYIIATMVSILAMVVGSSIWPNKKSPWK